MEIAASGGHNLLMIGPPGSGKSMLAQRLPSILPPLTSEEILEISLIHSVAGLIKDGHLINERPFRDPHHSASLPALVGGGAKAKPGEITLAHRGVLFLDELPEFSRQTIDSLRQPIETGKVVIARANSHVTYPAQFQLICAMNPCRCGHLDDPSMACTRAPKCALEYQNKISGPIFDRIDMHIDVPAVKPSDLSLPSSTDDSAKIKARVIKARNIQLSRYKEIGKNITCNAYADPETLEKYALLEDDSKTLLLQGAETFKLSARAYHRLIKVARTIADLDNSETIKRTHTAEALSYRRILNNG